MKATFNRARLRIRRARCRCEHVVSLKTYLSLSPRAFSIPLSLLFHSQGGARCGHPAHANMRASSFLSPSKVSQATSSSWRRCAACAPHSVFVLDSHPTTLLAGCVL